MNGFSVIIPVYNEEEIIVDNVERLMNFLEKLAEPYQIVVVSNGSTDSTVEKGQMLQKKYSGKMKFFVIKRRGVGLAFKKAIKSSSFIKNISIDMDLSTDLNFIPKCLKLLDEYDIVIGSKKVGAQKRSFLRKLMSDTYITLVRILLGLKFSDYSIGTKGYRKDKILKCLKSMDEGSFYVIETFFLVHRNNGKIKEIPVFCHDVRKSKFSLFQEAIYRFKNLLILSFPGRKL